MLPLLLLATMIGPLTINILLPALPGISRSLATTRETAQLTISVYVAVVALGQLFIGPISDRFGRRPVMIVCSTIYTAGSLLAALAGSIEALIGARILQAVGATAGMALSRTIISDVSNRSETMRILAYLTAVMVLAPLAAPMMGALLDAAFGWWSIFIFCTILGTVQSVLCLLFLRETRPKDLVAATTRDIVIRSLALLKNQEFLRFAGTGAAATGSYFAILGGAPSYMIEGLGRTPTEFSRWLMLLGLGYASGNILAGRLSAGINPRRMCALGNLLMVVFSLLATGLSYGGINHPLALFGPAAMIAVSNGIAMPGAVASAIQSNPQAAGAASGLMGFMQLMLSAFVSYIVAWATTDSALPITLGLLACALLSVICVPPKFIFRSG